MLFVSYAGTDGDIADTIIKWKGGNPNTLKSIEKLRKALAANSNGGESTEPHHIKIINWRRLKGRKKK